MTDYLSLWDRWLAFSTLPEEDGKTLLQNLHEEVRAGTEMLGVFGGTQIDEILTDVSFDQKKEYLEAAAPILSFAALHGYCLFLMSRGVNPVTANLKNRPGTAQLGVVWMEGYKKDQHAAILQSIDPILFLILGAVADVRINQLLAVEPRVVDLRYKVTERIHQTVRWAACQGFVLGVLEERSV